MSTTLSERTGTARVLGLIVLIFGAIFIVAGGVTWGAVSANLADEKITVAPDASAFGGQDVNSPWTAFSQAMIIRHHALTASNDKTYAELGAMISAKQADLKAAGKSADEIAKDADVVKLQGQRTTVMNGSFLRASLFTSVIAFGVALFAVGVGAVFALIGWTLMKLSRPAAVATAAAREPVAV
ncbi:aromatic ring-opening dioxygenase LigA [Cellulomonas sp. 73-145]|uniref:aromatic ring-opening dioxygenase LigA n=1 Tax=Cellulomonas sp. 73-145 TaxID=1895739 RepID=UPI000A413DBE|nr:aromatic ring-opening dioxygenase LigA [Cellulomonas sp. 73-145]MBN9326162.1 aromatic ring-opening dioxygenase LigA [Cellulomonas sp.]